MSTSTSKIHLEPVTDNKLLILKAIKELTGMGLKDAKDLMDRAPVDFEVNGDVEDALALLKQVGANVTALKPLDIPTNGNIPPFSQPEISDKTIRVISSTSDSITIAWTKATDKVTPQNKLRYSPTWCKTPYVWDNKIRVCAPRQYDIDSYTIRGLEPGVSYDVILYVCNENGTENTYDRLTFTSAVSWPNPVQIEIDNVDNIPINPIDLPNPTPQTESRYIYFDQIDLPSLAPLRDSAIKAFQTTLRFDLWEAERLVDRTPLLFVQESSKIRDLEEVLVRIGLQTSIFIGRELNPIDPPVMEGYLEEMKFKLETSEHTLQTIQNDFNRFIALVTLSKVVANLIAREAPVNISAAKDNYSKLLIISNIAETIKAEAYRELEGFFDLTCEVYDPLFHSCQCQDAYPDMFKEMLDCADGVLVNYNNAKALFKKIEDSIKAISESAYSADIAIKNLGENGQDWDAIVDKYSGEAIYKGLTALTEINYALPLPHTVRGTVFRRSQYSTDSSNKPFVGALVEIGGIVSPTEDKTEADEKPSCYTDSNGEFIIVMPERYSLKETIRIIVSQGANRQTFLKSAADFLYSVPEQLLLDQFVEVDYLGQELSNLKLNLSEIKADYDVLTAYKTNMEARMAMYVQQLRDQKGIDPQYLDEEVMGYVTNLGINLQEANVEIEREQSELGIKLKKIGSSVEEMQKKLSRLIDDIKDYEGRYNSKKTILFKDLKEQKFISFPETTPLDRVFDEFLAKTIAPEARLEGTNLKEEYEGFLVIDEVFKSEDTNITKALPSVKFMENEGREVRLPSDSAPSRVFSYSMLQRLVEPKLTKLNEFREKTDVERGALSDPVNVMDFKDKMTEDPDSYPQMSTLGMGYVLNMHQAWVPDGFALGSLLYSLVLAPGEEQRLIVRENKQSYILSDNAMGSETVSEDYQLSQSDDTSAIYNYALSQLTSARSSYDYESHTGGIGGAGGFGGIGNAVAGMLGLSGGYSKSWGKGSSSASQSNSHNEASAAAQSFQHNIKSASDKVSQAKRISVSTASSDVSESVATKIIANHNHSHAMTIQYWEVMRRYRLETCVEGVDLALFVPLKLVRFLPVPSDKESDADIHDIVYQLTLNIDDPSLFGKQEFDTRYAVLLKYANTLQYALPSKYRQGLRLIQQYSALPSWTLENKDNQLKQVTFKFKTNLLWFDKLTGTIVFRNGKGSLSASPSYELDESSKSTAFDQKYVYKKDLIAGLHDNREGMSLVEVKFTFSLPSDCFPDDISSIRITRTCERQSIPLMFDALDPEITSNGNVEGMKSDQDYAEMGLGINQAQGKAIVSLANAYWDYVKDHNSNANDVQYIAHFRSQVPDCMKSYPNKHYIELTDYYLRDLDPIKIQEASFEGDSPLNVLLPTDIFNSSINISVSSETKTLKLAELKRIEETFSHVISETMHYSQTIWADMSSDERAMMLEQYTIDMNFSSINDSISFMESEGIKRDCDGNGSITIPLLNCVNVKKVMGFYGNCILLPFTYPSSLARKLGKTAGEIQDALYRYHTNSFRAPTTTISLPTSGMVGEAVLGETNVSEKIDLTRFWNWQDSPIDKMNLDNNYLSGKDYLSDKSTSDITGLNLQGASAAQPVTNADLITALVNKQMPSFNDITGLDQLKEVMNAATSSAAQGRETYIKESSAMADKALSAYSAKEERDNQLEIAKLTAEKGTPNKTGAPEGSGAPKGTGDNNVPGGVGGPGGAGGGKGQGGGGSVSGPSASFTATLTFNTGNMNGKTTASTKSLNTNSEQGPDDQTQPATSEGNKNDNEESTKKRGLFGSLFGN